MTWSRGQKCGDIELPGYLVNVTDPVALVLDLRIVHERWGSTSDPTLNGNLHYPNDIESSCRSLRFRSINRSINSLLLILLNLRDLHVSLSLTYTRLYGGLEHLKIETRLRDERFECVKGECVI